ncbi:hypothetical protein RZS08_13385, partial [Arthrospira platensis SPKY1]|nr:hypothetical protein [Arthrospira platensis SPKY1]
MHVDKAVRWLAPTPLPIEGPQLLQTVRSEAGKHEESAGPHKTRPALQQGQRLRLPVQQHVGPEHAHLLIALDLT